MAGVQWLKAVAVFTALGLSLDPLSLLKSAQSLIPTARPDERTLNIGVIFDSHDVILRKSLGRMVDDHNMNAMTRGFFLRAVIVSTLTNDSARLQIAICDLLRKHRVIALLVPGSQYVGADLFDIARTLQVPIFSQNIVPPPDEAWAMSSVRNSKSSPSWSGSRPRGGRIRNGSFLFTMLPDIHRPLTDLLILYGAVNFTYVCNSDAGLMRMEAVIQRFHENSKKYVDLRVDVRYLKNPAFAVEELRNLDKYLSQFKRRNVVLDLDNAEDIVHIIKQLGQLGMMRDDYHYFLTVANSYRFRVSDYIYSGVNISTFNLAHGAGPTKWSDHRGSTMSPDEAVTGDKIFNVALMRDSVAALIRAVKQVLADSNLRSRLPKRAGKLPVPVCFMRSRFNNADGAKIFAWNNGKQLVAGEWWLGTMLANILERIRFHGRTQQVAFDESGRRDNYTLQVIEMQHREGMRVVGSWNTHEGLNLAGDVVATAPEVLENKNKTYIVTTIISPPFTTYRQPRNDEEKLEGNDRFEGFCIELVKELSLILNFRYKIQVVRDGKYGAITHKYPNSTSVWNGMIGELLNGTADIAVAPLTISSSRARVVKFSEPFLTFGISLMIRRPGKKKPGIFSFLLPLANSVWWCISTACFVVACGLYIIARISPYEWTILEDKVERDFSFMNSIWFSFSAFVQQGVDVAPRSPGARILSSVWWFFTLIMIAYYTANLAAFLTVSRIVKPINTWNDLLNPPIEIEYGTLDSGSTKNFFMNTKLSPFRQMGEFMKANKHVFVNTTEVGVNRVRQRKGGYAFIMESSMNDYYNNRAPCDTIKTAMPFGDKGYGVATPKDSPLAEKINEAVLQLRENQKLAESRKKWWIERGECHSDNEQSKSKALALINVAGAFYVLVAGLGLALFTALLEFYCVVRREYRKSKTSFPEMVRRKARMSMAGVEIELPVRQDFEYGRYGMVPVARTINLI